MKKLIILFFIGFSFSIFGQSSFSILNQNVWNTIGQVNQKKISSFNFNKFRFTSIDREIQIKNGPKLTLFSVSKYENKGGKVSFAIKQQIIERNEENLPHLVIPIINVGITSALPEPSAEMKKILNQKGAKKTNSKKE